MTPRQLIQELNKMGYVVVPFTYEHYKLEGEPNPSIEAVQACVENEYFTTLEDTFCDVMVQIHEDIELHFDEDF